MKSDSAMELGFVVLFPYGKKGYSHKRHRKVEMGEFLKHCYFYHDRRFLTHKIFLYWALN